MNQRKSLTSLKSQPICSSNKVDYLTNMDINENINEDIEISSTTLRTLEIMKICRKRIIYPFNIMLMMVGWRPLGSQIYHSDANQRWVCILNNILLVVLVVLVLFSYTYQVLTCRFVMSPEDKISTKSPFHYNGTNTTFIPLVPIIPSKVVDCNHMVTTYVVPNFIHFIAYMIGMVHYRFRKNEDIYGLMEKALQYFTSMEQNKKSQYKITRVLTIWMALAVIWVLLSMGNHIMYDVVFDTFSKPFYNTKFCTGQGNIKEGLGNFLFILDIFGFLIMSIVTAVVILNYTLYCELVRCYVNAISKKIEMRNIKLNVVKNDIQIIGIAIDLINSTTGSMTSLIFVYIMSLFVGGSNMLFTQELTNEKSQLVFRCYFIIHLIPLFVVPLIQCVRVNKAVSCFKEWAMHMSVFGYRKEKRKELDSFLLYTIGYKSKARLLSLPLEWPHLCILFIFGGFILLSLVQAGGLNNFKYIGEL